MIHTIEKFNVSSRECSELGLPSVKGITKRKALLNVMHIPKIRVTPLENKRRGAQNYEIPPRKKNRMTLLKMEPHTDR
jgi:hypothetical protein